MSVTLNFQPPRNFNLVSYEVGESTTASGDLNVVASGTDIGSFPCWINRVIYPSGITTNYYAVRFVTDVNERTGWTDRMYGQYGVEHFFVFNPPGSPWVYLVPSQPSGNAGEIPYWLQYNYEYTVYVESSGLWASGMAYMQEDYVFSFDTEMCPAWSSVDSVRLIGGPLFDHLPNDTIFKMIYRASLEAMSSFFSFGNPFGCSYVTVPEPLYRWVTCMAGLYALNTCIARLGNTSKKLGTFDVSYGMIPGAVTPADIRREMLDCIANSAITIQALAGTLLTSATKSLFNHTMRHPQGDPEWGRHPRKVDMFVHGPWRRAFNDIKLYYSNYMMNPYEWGLQHMINASHQQPGTIV